ncbi:maker259 [Drosophila busckii]|uniref:Maker259 n=1 Tax=Drosophila busckii TaxID=30019 RepID=A0A0M3QYM7_DROBS|nr:maker259 [Drosophila busckii]
MDKNKKPLQEVVHSRRTLLRYFVIDNGNKNILFRRFIVKVVMKLK